MGDGRARRPRDTTAVRETCPALLGRDSRSHVIGPATLIPRASARPIQATRDAPVSTTRLLSAARSVGAASVITGRSPETAQAERRRQILDEGVNLVGEDGSVGHGRLPGGPPRKLSTIERIRSTLQSS